MDQRHVTLIITILYAINITLAQQDDGCGERVVLPIRAKIIRGSRSRSGMWPWQVGIHKNVLGWRFICGGALIAPQWVLTTAHCFYVKRQNSVGTSWFEKDITPDTKYKVRAGDHEIHSYESTEQEQFPVEVHVHPGYRHAPYYDNDIALVKLNQTVNLSPYVRTVCLPMTSEDLAKPGAVGTVAGWGKTESGLHSSTLHHSTYMIQNNTFCDRATNYFFNSTVTFCAGDGKGIRDTCHGDSGGSMVRNVLVNGRRRWVTVGVVSWGEGCALKGNYGYYTRLQPFVDWIRHKMNDSISSCGNPGNIPHGRLIGVNFSVESRVIYKCISGYRLKGKSGRKCKANGRWTRPPTCVKEATCPDPGHPRNGMRRPTRSRYHYRAKLFFQCSRNHVIIGRSTLYCRRDGTWNGHAPLCLAPCLVPVEPKNGVRLGTNFKHGQIVRFRCNKDFRMSGSSFIICSNGQWNNDSPKCYNGICGDPGSPYNGWRNGNDFLKGKQVTFTCKQNYDLIGLQAIQCLGTGHWSGPAPVCKSRCRVPNYFGKVKTDSIALRNGDWIKHDTKLTFYCNFGQELVGGNETVCNNGHWSNAFPECKGDCVAPRAISNGYKTGNNYRHGKWISFGCYAGYRLKGKKYLNCDDGQWSGEIPTCIGVCPDLVAPSNGVLLDNNYESGATVRFRCNNGFTLRGPRNITCNNKQWNNKPPACKDNADCIDPGIPLDGQRQGDVFSHLSIVNFTCNNGLTLIGPSQIQCLDEGWTKSKPVCEECGSSLGMESGKIPDTSIRASSQQDWYHTAKYGRLNNGRAWCSRKQWSPYLEIDLGKPYKITYLATQGSSRDNIWVTKYVITHNLARNYVIEYRENNREKLFTGNTDATSVAKHRLEKPFIARKLRFLPFAKTGFFITRACMRVEVYGCDLPKDCVVVGSRVLGKWYTNYLGADVYFKAYVKTINEYDVQVEIESEDHNDEFYKTISKKSLVLDIPPKQEKLRIGTRVLAPSTSRYFAGKITNTNRHYYLVRGDDGDTKWFTMDKIRRLKVERFCE